MDDKAEYETLCVKLLTSK